MARKKNTLITDFNDIPKEALIPEDEQPYPIPDRWKWVALGNVITLIGGGTPSKKHPEFWENGSIPWMTVKDLNQDQVLDTQDHITIDGLQATSPLCDVGDLVLATRISPGRSAISMCRSTVNQDLKIVKTSIALPKYIKYFFDSNHALFNELGSGTTVSGVRLEQISSIPFPLPPLDEQRAIVDALESHTNKIDQAIAAARSFLNDFEDTRCTLIEYFIGIRSSLDGFRNLVWLKKAISDIGEIVTGSTPSTKVPEFYGGDLPFIKPGDLDAGRHVISATSFLTAEGAAKTRTLPAPVVAVCGIGTIGKCGLVEVPCATNQQIHAIVPNADCDPIFLYYLMSSKRFKNQIIESSSATTLPIINKTRFSSLVVEIPASRDIQERIVSDLETKLNQLDEAESATREALGRLTDLRQKLGSMAISGKLAVLREGAIA